MKEEILKLIPWKYKGPPLPWKRNAKKSKMAVWGALTNSYEKEKREKHRLRKMPLAPGSY